MNEIKRSYFICFLFFSVFTLSFNLSTIISNAGSMSNIEITKMLDPSIVDTTEFSFNIQDNPQVDTDTDFTLQDGNTFINGGMDFPTDEDYLLTESNPPGFIVVGAECSDGNGPLGPPDVVVTIDNEMDPSLMVDISLMGTQQIQCTVTNTNDFQMLTVTTSGTGTGSVTATNGGGFPIGIDCPTDCTELVPDNSSITLNATPDSGSVFTTWGEDCSGTNVQTTETVLGSDISCDAQFDDVDECTDMTDNCDTNATCTNEQPGFSCACNAGYEGDGVTCTDIDACTSTPCDTNASCVDDPPPALGDASGRTCTCNTGYEGNGEPGMCTDIDACVNNPCDTNATCTDLPPPAVDDAAGRMCACNAGFEGNGETGMCTDIDACLNNPCGANAICMDNPAPALDNAAGRTCVCAPGFEGNPETGCTEIPECVGNNCEQVCLPLVDDFECGCFGGFVLDEDGISCNPADSNIEIGNEQTNGDGLQVTIEVGDDVLCEADILVDLPSQVLAEFANLSPDIGDCFVVDQDANANVVDVDIICEIDQLDSVFDLDIGLCTNGDQEGLVNAEIEVIAECAPGGDFDEIVQILLNSLDECGGGGGCSIASSNTNISSGLSNLLVTLIPAVVGFGAMFFRRRNLGARD